MNGSILLRLGHQRVATAFGTCTCLFGLLVNRDPLEWVVPIASLGIRARWRGHGEPGDGLCPAIGVILWECQL